MKRLLCIVGAMNSGGSETFLMKIYRKLDKAKYQMDFAEYTQSESLYDEEIQSLGGKIFHLCPKSKGFKKNYKQIYELVKANSYKYVLRSGQNAASGWELLAAKRAGATTLIMKSTNSKTMNGTIKEKTVHLLFKPLIKRVATVKIGPSKPTLDFMFGKNSMKHGAKLFKNAIDPSVYRFSKEERNRIRSEFGISQDEPLSGSIGRLTKQKNQTFLLDILACYKKTQPKAKLLLVGDGELKNELMEKAEKIGLVKDVIFTGVRKDIPACLSAMDVFLLPSLYEGLPNTAIEAQAVGVPCIISNTITKEALVTDYIDQLPLEDANVWAKAIQEKIGKFNPDPAPSIINAGYDINNEIIELTDLFFGESKHNVNN